MSLLEPVKARDDSQPLDESKPLYATLTEVAGEGLADMGVTTTEARWLLPIAAAIHSLRAPHRKGRRRRE